MGSIDGPLLEIVGELSFPRVLTQVADSVRRDARRSTLPDELTSKVAGLAKRSKRRVQ